MDEKILYELKNRVPVAEYVAANAGSLIVNLFHNTIKTYEKTVNDYVTELDKNIESMALRTISQQFPDDGFFGEENVGKESKNGFEWVVDPIDGTNNYVRGLTLCGFQMALTYKNEPIYAVIHRPLTQEIYTATKGSGAIYKNNLTGEKRKLTVSNRNLSESIGIFDAKVGKTDNKSTKIMLQLADRIAMIRVFGVAVVDLPAIAEGSCEFLVSGIAKKYDIVAGLLLIEEAGGISYTIEGGDIGLDDNLVIFSNQTVKPDLLSALNK
jgi:fructose-1,6-bisphosphatase/inositol monophosphatase family enzyme